MRGLHQHWTGSSRVPTSRKRSVWRNRKLKKKINSFAKDRSLTWSTTTSGLLALMIPFLITLIYSQLIFAMMMFRNSIRDGMKFYCRGASTWWCPGKLVLKTVLELDDLEIHQKRSKPDYQTLKTMVKRSIDQKLRLRNFDARNERIETRAVVTSRRGQRGVESGQGECYQWKAKGQCSRGDNCSFRRDENKRAKSTPKNRSTLWTTERKEWYRSISRRKSLGGLSPSGKFVRLLCRDYTNGKCTRPSCDCWHPPEGQFYETESSCKFGEKCSFAHRQVEAQPSRKLKKDGDKRCSGFFEGCTTFGLHTSRHRAVGIFIDITEEHKSLGTNSTCAILKKLRCVTQTSEKAVKMPHQRSPYAPRFEDRSQEETERQERCARGDAWRPARSILKLREKDKSCLFLTYRGLVSPSTIRNKTIGKRIRCRLRSNNAHVEQERPELSRNGNRKGLSKSDDGCCSQWRSANKWWGDHVCQRIRLFRDSQASRRYTDLPVTRKTLRGSRIFLRVDQRSETTTH